jgi:glycosyltransferase involved in cell wall biosynthesis
VHYWGDCDEPWYRKVFEAARKTSCKVIENINTPVAPFIDETVDRYVYVSNYAMHFKTPIVENSMVIHPGSNLGMFQRNGAPIPDDTIGMVYRLEGDKLSEESIRVFIEVVKRRPKSKVIVVGGGTFLQPYKRQVQAEGVENNFEFTGYVTYEKLPSYYRRFALFVAPVWKESFGQVSPFAMSMEIPVVGYDVGALSEILGGGEYLAKNTEELTEIIISLLNDRKKRIQIGKRNKERVYKYFSVEAMVKKYDSLYQDLLTDRDEVPST